MSTPVPSPPQAEAPRVFTVYALSSQLVDVGATALRIRVGFGPYGGVEMFHRDFPLLGAPAVGSRWEVVIRPVPVSDRG